MNKFYTLILSILTFSLGINAQITELFFSEYAEGSSNNKYLEIYNGTSSTISLDNYAFPSTSNGADVTGQPDYWNTFPTGASIAPGDVYIIAHPSADPSILAHADHTYTYLSNGDDGFALVSGGTLNDANGDGSYDPGEMTGYTLLDHIGNWGADPGSGWPVAGVTNGTKEHTLVRKSTVTGPNSCWDVTCGNGSAGTNASDSEWIVYPQDTWTYLGSHPHTVSPPSNSAAALVGTWKLSPVGGALAVGNQGQGSGNWWTSALSEVTNRACIFDDSIKLEANGNMTHYMDGSTWLEPWQGTNPEACASPVAPHDGGSDTWSFANNQLTVNGVGAHFGLPKAYNGGELDASSTVPASRTYEVSFSTDSSQMYLDIASAGGGSGWWRFTYQKTSYVNAPISYDVTLSVNMSNETGFTSVYAGGGVLGGANALALSDPDGDGTWTGVATFPVSGGAYVFVTDPNDGNDYSGKEDLAGQSCAVGQWNDREMLAITSDTTVLHCFGSCETDGSCPSLNDCGVTGTYDYGNNEDVSNAVGFTANAGDYITLDFTAGITESCCDAWFIMDAADGTGNVIATGAGSIVGTYTSTTGEISFYVDSDASWSPAGGGGSAGVTHATFVYSVSCSAPPSCPNPSGLTATNITSTIADIAWTAGGTETAWNVDYGAPGFTPGTGTNITTNPYSLTGLSGNTSYDIYIQADCGSGDVSAWVGPVSIS
ncbi:MAG: lamin tail domain-containing protein, partial [Flavobacteriales bacterium]|nr:lamin tail domain-containing protein [Flavobacteriales bacterium]